MNNTLRLIIIFQCIFLLSSVGVSSICTAQTVYTTKTGEKYHEEGCRYLSKSKLETTITKAEELGYTPCSVCKPKKQAGVDNVSDTAKSVTKIVVSRQCSSLTQAGKRCSRMTKEANGRCWQHQ